MPRSCAPWWMYIIATSLLGNFSLSIYLYFWGPEPPFSLFNFKKEALVVEEVLPNSAGDRAGLQVGDRVLAIDGRRVRGLAQWDAIRANFEVGKAYQLQVERDGRRFEGVITLQRRSWSQQRQFIRVRIVLNLVSALLTLLVAFLIAFTRPYDWVARIGALSVALLGEATPLYGVSAVCGRLPTLVGALIWWPTVGAFVFPALFLRFLFNFPAQIAPFSLDLGGDGTVDVFQAVDTALERRVAVKVIRDDLVGSAEAAERFRREARAAAAFAHPNVVTVYDFGLAAGTRAFLVMELLSGATLRKELQKERRLAPPRALSILRGVCAAVEAAHRRQLLHRDLKPENIFLVRGDSQEMAKVLDFGIAKFLPSASQQATADTGTGMLVGTLQYMSPEQLRGDAATPAWDLWALAVVAYETLTGVHLYAGGTLAELSRDVAAGRFRPVNTYLPEAPPRWQKFFEYTLAPEPEHRPRSATLFVAEFESALA